MSDRPSLVPWQEDDAFLGLLGRLIERERGYVEDTGGRTLYGISEEQHPEAWHDGPPTLDTAALIYYDHYYREVGGKEAVRISRAVARELMDTAVLTGTGQAVRTLQQALNTLRPEEDQVAVDGIWGPETRGALEAAVAAGHEDAVVTWQNVHQGSYLLRLIESEPETYRRYAAGWTRRLEGMG